MSTEISNIQFPNPEPETPPFDPRPDPTRPFPPSPDGMDLDHTPHEVGTKKPKPAPIRRASPPQQMSDNFELPDPALGRPVTPPPPIWSLHKPIRGYAEDDKPGNKGGCTKPEPKPAELAARPPWKPEAEPRPDTPLPPNKYDFTRHGGMHDPRPEPEPEPPIPTDKAEKGGKGENKPSSPVTTGPKDDKKLAPKHQHTLGKSSSKPIKEPQPDSEQQKPKEHRSISKISGSGKPVGDPYPEGNYPRPEPHPHRHREEVAVQ